MLAGLLYVIGLIAVLVSIAIAGYGVPDAVNQFTAAMWGDQARGMTLIGDPRLCHPRTPLN